MTSDETALNQPGPNNPEPVDYNPDEFWLRTLLRWYIGLIIRPSPTIREIVEREPPIWMGMGTLLLFGFVWSFLSISLLLHLSYSSLENVWGLAYIPLFLSGVGVLVIAMLATALHVAARLLGGSGKLTVTLAGVTLFSALSPLPAAIAALTFVLVAVSDFWSEAGIAAGIGATIMLIAFLFELARVAILSTLLISPNYALAFPRAARVLLTILVLGLPLAVAATLPLLYGWLLFYIVYIGSQTMLPVTDVNL